MSEDFDETARKLLFAGVGSVTGAIEKFEDTLDELAELGELRTKNSEGFIREILDRVKAEREEFNTIVIDILQDALNTLGFATRSDVDEIEERLRYLNKKVRGIKVRSGGGKAAVKKSIKAVRK